MHKPSESHYHSNSTLPMIVLLLLGLLFFGTYIVAEHVAPDALPGYTAPVFLAIYVGLSALAFLFFWLKERKQQGEQKLMETLNTKMHNMFKYSVGLPYAVADEQGRIRALNSALQQILGVEDPFFRGTISDFCGGVGLQEIIRAGISGEDVRTELGRLTMEAIFSASEDTPKPAELSVRNMEDGVIVRFPSGDRYVARAYAINLGRMNYLVTFTDVSELLELKEKMDRDMPAVAYIDIDNLEELTQYTHVNYRDASRQVDDILIQWTASLQFLLLIR